MPVLVPGRSYGAAIGGSYVPVLVPGRGSTQIHSRSNSLPLSSTPSLPRPGRVALLVSGGRRGSPELDEVSTGSGGGRDVGGGAGGGIFPPVDRDDGPVLVGRDSGNSFSFVNSILSFSEILEGPIVATVEAGGGGGEEWMLGGGGGGPVGGFGRFG